MMRRTVGFIEFMAVIAVIGSLAWYAGNRSGRERNSPATPPMVEQIQTGTPERRDFAVRIRWLGKVESTGSVSLIALEPGRIVSVTSPDETAVRKGALLFTLGGPRVQRRSGILRARIVSLRERVALVRQTTALKQEAVAQRISKREELLSAKNSLSRLRTKLGDAERAFSSFQENLRVRAPRDGVVTGRRVNVGQEVEKGDVLAELVPPKSLRIVATLYPPGNIPLVGLPAAVETPDGKEVFATVTKVRPRRTPEGASTVWLEGGEIHRHFAPGETVSGRLVLSRHENALALPLSAIVRDEQERAFVFVKGPGGYHQRSVKTGEVSDGWVEIKEGVGEGDSVVVRGAYELFYRDFNRIYKVED